MAENCGIEIQNIGHLGLIAAVFKELKLVEKIDAMIPKTSNNRHITHGEAVMAMVMQSMGYSGRRFYLSSDFFSKHACKRLFGRYIDPEHINARVLGRTLDAIHEYGSSYFLSNLCLGALVESSKIGKFLFIDTTSFAVTGKKYQKEAFVEPMHGYSKDHRPDLKQLVYLLATNENALPLYAKVHSGNASDGDAFAQAILNIQHLLGDKIRSKFFVLDSALYSKKFLKNKQIKGYWITRVPESVKQCKSLLESDISERHWYKVDDNYSYQMISGVRHGGTPQRWVVVDHRPSRYKELASFHKKLQSQEKSIVRAKIKLDRLTFKERSDCANFLTTIRQKYKYFTIIETIIGRYRKSKASKGKRILSGYSIHITHRRNTVRIKKMERRKGKFVLATNCLDSRKISSSKILSAYRNRNRANESCFKFLKSREKNLNQIFLKKTSRIESMLMVMGLLLFVNNAAEGKIRNFLADNRQTIPNQLGRATKTPSFSWASHLMMRVSHVFGIVNGVLVSTITGIDRAQRIIIRAFGSYAQEIYEFP